MCKGLWKKRKNEEKSSHELQSIWVPFNFKCSWGLQPCQNWLHSIIYIDRMSIIRPLLFVEQEEPWPLLIGQSPLHDHTIIHVYVIILWIWTRGRLKFCVNKVTSQIWHLYSQIDHTMYIFSFISCRFGLDVFRQFWKLFFDFDGLKKSSLNIKGFSTNFLKSTYMFVVDSH